MEMIIAVPAGVGILLNEGDTVTFGHLHGEGLPVGIRVRQPNSQRQFIVSTLAVLVVHQGCQPVRNFRILYGFYMQNTGVRIWPRKYGN